MDKMKNRSSFLFRSWNDEGLRALCACIEHGGRQDPVLPPCSDAKTMVKEHVAGTVPSRTDGSASSMSTSSPVSSSVTVQRHSVLLLVHVEQSADKALEVNVNE